MASSLIALEWLLLLPAPRSALHVGTGQLLEPHLSETWHVCCACCFTLCVLRCGALLPQVSKYFRQSMLFDMHDFKYNDTFVRAHAPPVQPPLPREFTLVYLDGWGCQPFRDSVLPLLRTSRPGDVLVINIGAHCSRDMTFDEWRQYVDAMAPELERLRAETGVLLVWRTSFIVKEHVFRSGPYAGGYVPTAHFNTDARRELFDSYVEAKLAPTGVHVWDVSGLTSMGEFKNRDMIHADAMTMWAMEHDMMDLFGCPSLVVA